MEGVIARWLEVGGLLALGVLGEVLRADRVRDPVFFERAPTSARLRWYRLAELLDCATYG